MAKKTTKKYITLGITVLILTTLACGSVQVGVLTPTSEANMQSTNDNQESESELAVLEEVESQTEDETAPAPAEEVPELPTKIIVAAWQGHIASLPEGSQYDDFVILSPEGTGEFGLTGATPEIEAEIRSLRDAADGPNKYVHLWGQLSCDVEDYNGCQLLVDKLRYGYPNSVEENIDEWMGTITHGTIQGGLSHVFELSGEYPMWYSIHASHDESLQAQIESLRDTGAVVQVSGKLLVGFPDVNGTRIEVSKLDVIEAGTEEQHPPETFDPTADWQIFISDRYDYQIKYPQSATISTIGPARFSSEDVPSGMTEEQYLDQLMKEYTDQLCVQIEYALGFIYISAPPNNDDDFMVHCGNPAFGAGETVAKSENIIIGEVLYQASGYEFFGNQPTTGETLDLHNEIFWVDLEDGTRIAYGATPWADATYEDYLMKTKEILLRILTTYEVRP
ncbi:hypothetical protein ACFLXI_06925 [Chloroflexota bacterium]